MPRYIKKPVEVNAWQLTKENIAAGLPDWFDHKKVHIFNGKEKAKAEIETLEGVLGGDEGDFIIQGIKGEFYPCKPDIFYATYDKAPKLYRDGDEDFTVLSDTDLAAMRFVTDNRSKLLGMEAYRRALLKQVEGKGVEFGKSVIKVEGMEGEYFIPDMKEQLSCVMYTPFPMIALRRIKKDGGISGKLQYTNQSHPNVIVVGEYDFGRKAGVKYDD